jgi:hypothetical protein
MIDDEIEWAWQKLLLENELMQSDGDAFETRFQGLCKAAWGDDFTPSIPMGSRGDLKCDGYRHSAETVFQCFGPRYGQVDVTGALDKIDEDFKGAASHWSGQLKKWTFVLNVYRDKVPSELIRRIAALAKLLGVEGRIWTRFEILELAQGIQRERRLEVLGRPPQHSSMARVTYENIGRALSVLKVEIAALSGDPVPLPPDVHRKMEWNALSSANRHFLSLGQIGAERVRRFLMDQVVPPEAERMAAGFRARYEECRHAALEPDETFRQMLIFAGGATGRSDRDVSSLAIVAHFFSTCEIFEVPEVTQ